jgi:hypothetical protein
MRPNLLAGTCLVLVRATGQAAWAQPAEPEPGGFEIGLRAGYALPFGELLSGSALRDAAKGSVPFIVDLGYRLTPSLYVGGLLSYAILRVNKTGLGCNTQVVDGPGDCSGTALRLAADVQYQQPLDGDLVAWGDAGFGLERLIIQYDMGGFGFPGPISSSWSGVEIAHVEVGVGKRLRPRVVVGPFASYAVGQFWTAAGSGNGRTQSGDITDKRLHSWLTLGIRAMFTAP